MLVIPEDPTHNGSILKPLVERLMHEAGRPAAHVHVLTRPRTTGFDSALNKLPGVLEQYAHFDLVLLMMDSDGKPSRARSLQSLEEKHEKLLCCAAEPEVEIWLLAGFATKLPAPWATVRAEPRLKEAYFQPFLREFGDKARPDSGRFNLMTEALRRFPSILERCPELKGLLKRLRSYRNR